MTQELLLEPLHVISDRLAEREVSSEELVRWSIERTEALDPKLNSYISFLPEQALETARVRDRERARGDVKGVFHGIPVSLKDVFDTAGIPTSAGARFLAEYRPAADAAVTRKLLGAGAVLMGKANMTRFAEGESGTNRDFGDMRNPWNLQYSASGSSGGSAAQLASGLVALSMGSDNGGSARNPASVCNVVGLKPTHGLISTEGMFPRAYTIDHACPITRTVRDAAHALSLLAPRESDSGPDYVGALEEKVAGTKLGLDRRLLRGTEGAVLRVFGNVLSTLEALGFEIRDVTLPSPEEMIPAMYTIFHCEWGVAHEPWLRERPEEYGAGARAVLLIPAVDYLKAQQERRTFQRRAAEAMKDVDLLVSPTYPIVRRSHAGLPIVDGSRISPIDVLRFTMPYDLLGLPAISLPGGFAEADAPVGFQIAGRAFDEVRVLRAAHAYERATDWHQKHPTI